MKPRDMPWSEYGRIEPGELATTLALAEDAGHVVATVRLENRSARVLHPFTFNLQSRLEVTLDGQEVPYSGPMVSVGPSEDLYTELAPGQVARLPVDLAESHRVPPDATGHLVVRLERTARSAAEPPAEAELTLGG